MKLASYLVNLKAVERQKCFTQNCSSQRKYWPGKIPHRQLRMLSYDTFQPLVIFRQLDLTLHHDSKLNMLMTWTKPWTSEFHSTTKKGKAHEVTTHCFSSQKNHLSSFVSINKHVLWGFQTKNCEAFCVTEGRPFWTTDRCGIPINILVAIFFESNCYYDDHGYHCWLFAIRVWFLIAKQWDFDSETSSVGGLESNQPSPGGCKVLKTCMRKTI